MTVGGRRGLRTVLLAFFCLIGACAAEPQCSPPAPPGLSRFHAALDALEAGRRDAPVTILHLGDSHIALDHMTGALRAHWTAAFGDAGRGLPPGNAYRYYAPQGYRVAMAGNWQVASSLRADAPGPFGLQGYRVSGRDPGAVMTIETEAATGEIEIDAMGAPASGALLLTIDGAAPLRLRTRAAKEELVQLSVPAAAAHRIALSPAGDGEVTLLGWAMLTGKRGVRYDSYGVSGATIDVVDHWDEATVDRQIERLSSDLVILGYGTNEGFGEAINLDAYAVKFERLVRRFGRLAPQASIAVIGAFDGERRAEPGTAGTCGDGWRVPARLDGLRDVQAEVARKTGAFYFDASRVMGRPCGTDQWARATPPLAWPDRVHLRPEGARRMGEAIWRILMGSRIAGACASR